MIPLLIAQGTQNLSLFPGVFSKGTNDEAASSETKFNL